MCNGSVGKFGNPPANITWTVTRGDTSELRIDFLNNDEVTAWDTDGWEYSSTAYSSTGDILDELEVVDNEGYVIIKIDPDQTLNWGSGYSDILAKLPFDLKVTIPSNPSDFYWTPVSGTIVLCADVSSGL